MNFSFESQGTHTYFVYTVAEDDVIDSMSLGMITNNKISGLAPTLFMQMDATKFIKYDVSAKISVKQFFTGQVNRKRLIGVFNGIVDAMLSAEDYMIDANSILLDLNYIFTDVSTCDTVLVCLPIVSDDLTNRDLGAFFKNIMINTQFDQTENGDHILKIFNYLNSAPVFSLIDFKKLLENIAVSDNPAPIQQPVVQRPQPQQAAPQPQVQQAAPQPQSHPQPTPQKPPVQPPVQPKAASQPSIAIPSAQAQPAQQAAPEKKISMFGLLMHYNKENAELYKQQKAAKKATQAQPAAPAPQPQKPAAQAGFAIPGQQPTVNQGFAIPGQTPSAAAPKAAQQTVQATPKPATPQAAPATSVQRPSYTPPQMPQGQSQNFGETTVLGGGGGIGETTVLGATPATQSKPHLLRFKNNERIVLDKPIFRIGKEKSYVDYFVGDNPAISRSHANIITREGEYFVVDTNSTNHTYVNGQMIQSNVDTKISHGTKIKLANEEFEFKLY